METNRGKNVRIKLAYTAFRPSKEDTRENCLTEDEQAEERASERLRHLNGICTALKYLGSSRLAWSNIPATEVNTLMAGLSNLGDLALTIQRGLVEDVHQLMYEKTGEASRQLENGTTLSGRTNSCGCKAFFVFTQTHVFKH